MTVPRVQQTVIMMVHENLDKLKAHIETIVNDAMLERIDNLEADVLKCVDETFVSAVCNATRNEVYRLLELPENKAKITDIVAKALTQVLA